MQGRRSLKPHFWVKNASGMTLQASPPAACVLGLFGHKGNMSAWNTGDQSLTHYCGASDSLSCLANEQPELRSNLLQQTQSTGVCSPVSQKTL